MSLLTLFTHGTARRVARTGFVVCLFACVLSVPLIAQSEETPAGSERKVVTRVEPKYPATLARLYIGGVVRLQVDIAANGTVEGAQLIGGNPILGQAAIAAVKQWKYAPGTHKSRQVERLEFDPHQ
ncbi:MAG TPA: energy transducer TonB [Dongiaceae bacterium]|nr:energy transducer TonB [Dongiaceae bacterium]